MFRRKPPPPRDPWVRLIDQGGRWIWIKRDEVTSMTIRAPYMTITERSGTIHEVRTPSREVMGQILHDILELEQRSGVVWTFGTPEDDKHWRVSDPA